MWYDINFGTVSWIDPQYIPWVTTTHVALATEHAWMVTAVLGLAATANYTPPPGRLPDVASYRRTRAYRALTSGYVRLKVDPKTKALLEIVETRSPVTDPGWTPPFALTKFPTAIAEGNARDNHYYPGERSPLSGVRVGSRHPHGALAMLAVAGQETVAHVLLKVRAGPHVDNLGVSTVGAPFHVPWVWCELLLTYDRGTARLYLYGVGSIFPSHAWYLAGRQRFTAAQIGDSAIAGEMILSENDHLGTGASSYVVRPEQMNLYRVFKKGALAIGPQFSTAAEAKLPASPVTSHVYTVEAGKEQAIDVGLETLGAGGTGSR